MGDKDFNEVEHYSGEVVVEDSVTTSATHQKHNAQGVVLVPQPSDDPRDPLVSPCIREAPVIYGLYMT